jgi:hypothetical protein
MLQVVLLLAVCELSITLIQTQRPGILKFVAKQEGGDAE